MPAFARWLVPVVAPLLALGAGFHALSPYLRPDAAESRGSHASDWAGVLAGRSGDGFERPTGAWRLALPRDHGGHPDARTETWTIAAHLRDDRGEDIGLQLALLRVGLGPPDAPAGSAWEPRALYRGHVTFLDEADGAAGEERFHRDAPGAAGHDAALRQVWLDDWSIRYGEGERGERMQLDVTVGGVALGLVLVPAKPAVAFDPDGGGPPFRGYAITRMLAEGFVSAGDDRQAVSGLAWLDHLWGEVPLPAGPIAWDRLQLQLGDGTDLSVIRTRRRDGGGTPSLSGYAVGPDGGVEQLAGAALRMQATGAWQADDAGASYPLEWRLDAGELRLDVAPTVDDQDHAFVASLWSGTVVAEGDRRGERVSGVGTLLLTGYGPE